MLCSEVPVMAVVVSPQLSSCRGGNNEDAEPHAAGHLEKPQSEHLGDTVDVGGPAPTDPTRTHGLPRKTEA